MTTRPHTYRKAVKSRQQATAPARAGWLTAAFVCVSMTVLSGFGVAYGPDANVGIFGLMCVAWLACSMLAVRGFNKAEH